MRSKHSNASVQPEITARDREIIRLIAGGATQTQAARSLGISAKTVHARCAKIRLKLRAKTMAEVVKHAVEHGMIVP